MKRAHELSPAEGQVQLHSGATLFWSTNAAGGRTYWSDEVGGGVTVWDTCLVSSHTLLEAIAVEDALHAAERRAEQREAQAKFGSWPAEDPPK